MESEQRMISCLHLGPYFGRTRKINVWLYKYSTHNVPLQSQNM